MAHNHASKEESDSSEETGTSTLDDSPSSPFQRIGEFLDTIFGPYVGQTLLLSAMFYFVLLGIVFVMEPTELTEEHVLIALIPFVILMVASGKLKEIRGPGGLALMVQHEGQSDILPEFTDDMEVGEHELMQKGGMDEEKLQEIRGKQPTALTFKLGREDYYKYRVIAQYVGAMVRLSKPFRYIVFLKGDEDDQRARFAGFMEITDFQLLLQADLINRMAGGQYPVDVESYLVEEIESGEIITTAGVVTATIQRGSTNKEALEKMKKEKTDKLAVVDERDQFIGVVTHDGLSRSMLLKLFRESSK